MLFEQPTVLEMKSQDNSACDAVTEFSATMKDGTALNPNLFKFESENKKAVLTIGES